MDKNIVMDDSIPEEMQAAFKGEAALLETAASIVGESKSDDKKPLVFVEIVGDRDPLEAPEPEEPIVIKTARGLKV